MGCSPLSGGLSFLCSFSHTLTTVLMCACVWAHVAAHFGRILFPERTIWSAPCGSLFIPGLLWDSRILLHRATFVASPFRSLLPRKRITEAETPRAADGDRTFYFIFGYTLFSLHSAVLFPLIPTLGPLGRTFSGDGHVPLAVGTFLARTLARSLSLSSVVDDVRPFVRSFDRSFSLRPLARSRSLHPALAFDNPRLGSVRLDEDSPRTRRYRRTTQGGFLEVFVRRFNGVHAYPYRPYLARSCRELLARFEVFSCCVRTAAA